MSGKPKNSGWGGKRDNQTGRPRTIRTTSDKTKAKWLKAARELAKERGETIEKRLLSMLWDDDVADNAKAAIAKIYNEALITKESAQSISVNKQVGPTIGLPPLREDPALKVVKG